MRNELEQLMIKHGAYWVVALVAVVISKMYSRERQTLKTVVRSVFASLVISYIAVEILSASKPEGTVFMYVFVASILSDVIFDVVMTVGTSVAKKIKDDPSVLVKYLPWGSKK